MNLDQLSGLLLTIGVVANAIYTWFASRTKAAAEETHAIKQRLERHNERLLKIEGELRHLPDKETVTDIRLALAELKGQVGQFGEKLSGVAHVVTTIDQWMRDREKEK